VQFSREVTDRPAGVLLCERTVNRGQLSAASGNSDRTHHPSELLEASAVREQP
jgi:hypothetical protein